MFNEMPATVPVFRSVCIFVCVVCAVFIVIVIVISNKKFREANTFKFTRMYTLKQASLSDDVYSQGICIILIQIKSNIIILLYPSYLETQQHFFSKPLRNIFLEEYLNIFNLDNCTCYTC